MNRTRNYYRKQRKRIIRKKKANLAKIWFYNGRPDGALAKNKFHCPIHDRQVKTTPKSNAYRYGDRKHNWKPHDARTLARMQSQVFDWKLGRS